MNVLIPGKVEEWFKGYSFNLEKFLEGCTIPIRTPEEWTEAEWNELFDVYWKGVTERNGAVEHATKIIEIATRPPSDPVAEMDEWLKTVPGWKGLHERWQAVKELLP